MDRFVVEPTPLPGLLQLRRLPRADARGYLERLYDQADLSGVFGDRVVRQVNRTLTRKKGAVRGMHLQMGKHAEAKLVTCVRGKVFDVAVDLRQGSGTFLHWHGVLLDGDGSESLFIPEGFAHGFQTLTDDCEMLYLHTAAYEPGAEMGVHPEDTAIAIAWPGEITDMSVRDGSHPRIDASFKGVLT
ncbi:dTDP-4-dehydrorhamnose 3,5-epimerase [Dyella marensis]|uniref:dTDP-4-dehydrorhamnose 3,5-epimerase n=1 Tax=Dyella marensis TaxID=500610 RepID=A0A1I2IJM0_9GAMM|nr:dTDP-4-dehydrorhamnose 3,5-epimerase [Dyella marensis]